MLNKLYIKNFALIDELEIPFGIGLNIITGETGAGKSIIVDALMLLLGERASPEFVRHGEKKAVIEGTFNIASTHPSINYLINEGYEVENESILIRREITDKNSRAFFNDTPIQINLLKKFGDLLVDFHGQHDHQILLNPETHIDVLDTFADLKVIKDKYLAEYSKLKLHIENYKETLRKEKSLKDKIEYISFELKEIEKVNPLINEDEIIEEEIRIRENSEMLFGLANEIYNILYNEENSAHEKLHTAFKNLKQICSVDSKFEPFAKDFETAIITIEEISKFTNNYISRIEFDPKKIEEFRERSLALKSLIKKYGSLELAVKRHKTLKAELEIIENFDELIRNLKSEINDLKSSISLLTNELTGIRKTISKKFEHEIESKLIELGIPEAKFNVRITNDQIINPKIDDLCIISSFGNISLFENGADLVEFHISTNKGEQTKSLASIASGGEISRVMLAIKNIIAKSDNLPMLVFDEIDTGISGRIAQKVGLSMKKLAKGHQIISITHLPQICALADKNILVEKFESNNRTVINARTLNENEKLRETARLISGETITEASIKNAIELVKAG